MWGIIRFLFILFIFNSNAWATVSLSPWYSQDRDKKTIINVELFLSSTCPHCHKADAFFKSIEPITPWLHVTRYVINENKEALVHFNQLLTEQNMIDFAVPSVFFCNSRWVGFATAQTTGKDFLHALNYCKEQIEQKGELSPVSVSVLRRWANANLFDSGMTEHPTAVKYISVMALMDAFNPCALFCLGTFLALLIIQNGRKDQLVMGLSFIVPLGLIHFIQQVYPSTFFEFLPWLRVPALLIGLLTLYLMNQFYKKRSTNLFIIFSVLLGIIIICYQQTCIMNWSLIFQQWLYNQNLSNTKIALYEFSYQVIYILPLILALIFYMLICRLNKIKPLIYKINSFGFLYLIVIGIILILYPYILSNLFVSLLVFAGVLIASLFFKTNDSNSGVG